MKPPKEGSRKAEIWRIFQKEGGDAAMAAGLAKQLARGTMISWFGVWKREGVKPASELTVEPKAPKGKPVKGAKPKAAPKAAVVLISDQAAPASAPRFDYGTEAQARKLADERAALNRMDPDCYHVITNGRGWAWVPKHMNPDAVPLEFENGDRVRDITRPNRFGVFENGGVMWDDGLHVVSVNTTLYLAPASGVPLPSKAPAEPKPKAKAKAKAKAPTPPPVPPKAKAPAKAKPKAGAKPAPARTAARKPAKGKAPAVKAKGKRK